MDMEALKSQLYEECARLEERKRLLSEEVSELEHNKELERNSADGYKNLTDDLKRQLETVKEGISFLKRLKNQFSCKLSAQEDALTKLEKDKKAIIDRLSVETSQALKEKDKIVKANAGFVDKLNSRSIKLRLAEKKLEEERAFLDKAWQKLDQDNLSLANNVKEVDRLWQSVRQELAQAEFLKSEAEKGKESQTELTKKAKDLSGKRIKELEKQQVITRRIKNKELSLKQKLEAVKRDRKESAKEKKRIADEWLRLKSSQISLRSAYNEAKRKGIIQNAYGDLQ